MRCTHCGVQLPDDAEFCIACHSVVGEQAAEPAPAPGIQVQTSTIPGTQKRKVSVKATAQLKITPVTLMLSIAAFFAIAAVTALVVFHFMK